jgi:hypothetical protein
MNKIDFINHCREFTDKQLIFALELDSSLICECPTDLLTVDLLCKLVENYSSAFLYIPKVLRSKPVCDAAFRTDVQLIKIIPFEYITEEMMYKAVCLNGALLCGNAQSEFLSDRVIKKSVESDSANMMNVPGDLLTEDIMLFCFHKHASLPSYLECPLPVLVRSMLKIIDDKNNGIISDTHKKEIENWELAINSIFENCSAYKILEDDDSDTKPRSFAFISLGIQDMANTEMHANNPIIMQSIIDYHGHDKLISIKSPLFKRKILESSMGI